MRSRPQELDLVRKKFEQNFNALKNSFLMMGYYWQKLRGVTSRVDHGRVQDKLDQWLGFKKVVAHYRQREQFPEYRDWYCKDYARRFHNDGAWVIYGDAAHELYEKEFREHQMMMVFIRQLVQSSAYKQLLAMEKELHKGIRLENQYDAQEVKRLEKQLQARQRKKAQQYQAKCRREQQAMLKGIQQKNLQGKLWQSPLLWEYAQAQQDKLHRVHLMRECVDHINDYLREVAQRFCKGGREKRAYHLMLLLKMSIDQYKQAAPGQKQQVYAKLVVNLFLHYCSLDDVSSSLSKTIEKSLMTLLRVTKYPPLQFQRHKPVTWTARLEHLYHVLRRALLHFLPGSEKMSHPFTGYLARQVLLKHSAVVDELLVKQGGSYRFSLQARSQLKQLQQFDHQEVSAFAKSSEIKIVSFNHCLDITDDEARDFLMKGY